jgi:hypothetical protein
MGAKAKKAKANSKSKPGEKNGVILIRERVGREDHTLPEGATLADLLRAAGVGDAPHVITIDGRSIEEFLVLRPGMVVTLVPVISKAVTRDSWRETFGMFKDDPHFQEMVEAGRAIREADREAARKEAEEDEA